jgi:hypothetical protein
VIISHDLIKNLTDLFNRVENNSFHSEIYDMSEKIFKAYITPVIDEKTTLFAFLLTNEVHTEKVMSNEEKALLSNLVIRISKLRIKLLTLTIIHELAYPKIAHMI